jgi:hypothetical protein
VRFLEQAVLAEALGDGADGVAHRPRQQTGNSLDDQARSHLAPTEHHVAHAELAVDEVLAHPVVDALVAAAEQAEPARLALGGGSQFLGHRLVEPSAAGAEQVQRPGRLRGVDGGEDRLGLHHHAGAAPERRVVDAAMHIGGVLAQVVQPQVEQTGTAGLAQQALGAEVVDQVREDGEHVDAHGVQA